MTGRGGSLGLGILFFFFAFGLSADDAVLLVETDPFGARVTIEGHPDRGPAVSPTLFREMAPGSVSLLIEKDGFETERRTLVLEAEAVTHLALELEPTRYLIAFPDVEGVSIGDAFVTSPYLRLPSGALEVRQEEERLELVPIYPRQSLLDGLTLAVPVTVALTAVVAVLDWSSPREPVPRLLPGVAVGFATSVGLFGATVALHVDRERYRSNYRFVEETRTAESADALRERIDALVIRGEFGAAQEQVEQFVRNYPEDRRVAELLFLRGRLFLLSGETDRAYAALRWLVDDYPTREYHDRAVALLAGIESNRGNHQQAELYRERRLFPSSSP